METKQTKATSIILSAVIVLGIAILLVFQATSKNSKNENSNANVNTQQSAYTTQGVAGGTQYRNTSYAIAFVLPSSWTVADHNSKTYFAAFDPRANTSTNQTDLTQGMKIEIYMDPRIKTLDDYVKASAPVGATKTPLQTGGTNGFQAITEKPMYQVTTYLNATDSSFMRIVGYMPEPSHRTEYMVAYDTILNSIQLP